MTSVLVLKAKKFGQAVQRILSKKWKNCHQVFVAFMQYISNFQHFEEKNQARDSAISDIIDSERSCYLNVLKAMF